MQRDGVHFFPLFKFITRTVYKKYQKTYTIYPGRNAD
jgi:hypothetical protein